MDILASENKSNGDESSVTDLDSDHEQNVIQEKKETREEHWAKLRNDPELKPFFKNGKLDWIAWKKVYS